MSRNRLAYDVNPGRSSDRLEGLGDIFEGGDFPPLERLFGRGRWGGGRWGGGTAAATFPSSDLAGGAPLGAGVGLWVLD